MKQLIIYRTVWGFEPYEDYLECLGDRRVASKIRTRIARARMGNLGDHKTVGGGVIELRIDFGSGYRIYLAQYGNETIVVLCVGDKDTQQKDISNAHAYWDDFKESL
jgi:putative addiction module killer protein